LSIITTATNYACSDLFVITSVIRNQL